MCRPRGGFGRAREGKAQRIERTILVTGATDGLGRATAHALAARGATVLREPRREPWGLDEMWIADPDGLRIAVVEVPPEHPMRRDPRG